MAGSESRGDNVVSPSKHLQAEDHVARPVGTALLELEVVGMGLVRIVGVVQGHQVKTDLVLFGPLELDQQLALVVHSELVAWVVGVGILVVPTPSSALPRPFASHILLVFVGV